jgi:hypothetical protein
MSKIYDQDGVEISQLISIDDEGTSIEMSNDREKLTKKFLLCALIEFNSCPCRSWFKNEENSNYEDEEISEDLYNRIVKEYGVNALTRYFIDNKCLHQCISYDSKTNSLTNNYRHYTSHYDVLINLYFNPGEKLSSDDTFKMDSLMKNKRKMNHSKENPFQENNLNIRELSNKEKTSLGLVGNYYYYDECHFIIKREGNHYKAISVLNVNETFRDLSLQEKQFARSLGLDVAFFAFKTSSDGRIIVTS